MKKNLILLLFYFCNGLIAQEKISIDSRLIDNDSKPVLYASIINITTSIHGTTSDENGRFLLKTRSNYNDKIQITALGFYELKLTVAELEKLALVGSIKLEEKPIDLGDVEVVGERFKQEFIGKSTQLLKKIDSSYYSYAISEKPGYSQGVYVQPRKRTNGLIDKIHFYVTADGSLDQPFTIRLLRTKGKLKNNRGYTIDQFDDMTESILLVQEIKAGWNTFDLYNSDIYVDSQPFFIMFTSLESLDESKARSIAETTESINLAVFADRKPNEIYSALSFNGIILYLAVAQVSTPIPAIYIEYSATKK
ncbi:MAG: hypothetical protein ACJAS3_001589 [Roseivirga sp.]|jgi:hypothetical protein